MADTPRYRYTTQEEDPNQGFFRPDSANIGFAAGGASSLKFSEDGSTGFYAETIDGPLCFAEEGQKIGKWIFVPEPTAPNRAVRRAEAEFTARVWKLNAECNAK